MKRTHWFLVSVVCLSLIGGGIWIKNNPIMVFAEKRSLKPQPLLKIQEIMIDQRIPLWFVRNKEIDVVSIGFLFKGAGSVSVSQEQRGIDALLEDVMDEGAGTYTRKEFKEFLLDKNIQLDISSTLDHCSIVVRTTKGNVAQAFEVIKIVTAQLKVDENKLNHAKENALLSLKQSLNKPNVIGQQKMNELIFGEHHPYTNKVQDQLISIPKLTKKQILDFQKKNLTKSSLKIVVCGNIELKNLTSYIEKTIQDFPVGESHLLKRKPLMNLSARHDIYADVPQSYVLFAQSGLPREHPDFYAWFLALRIIGEDNFNARLFREIREKQGLAYTISAGPFSNALASGVKGNTATKSDNVEKVIQLIRQEWHRVKQEGITQEELDFAKEQIMGEYELSFDSTVHIVQKLMNFLADGLPVLYVNNRNQYFSKLTLQDVNRVIRQYIRPQELLFVAVGKHGKK